jgi:hypothetical protein
MNDRIFNAKAQRRKDAKEEESLGDLRDHRVANGKSIFSLVASSRLCVFALNFLFIICVSLATQAADASKPLYQNSFTTNEVGKLPDEMLLLDGGFAVQDVSGNKVLQLPGAPLDTYGVLFGPTESAGLALSARVHSTKKGRREPAFAIGLNGNAGYKLQVSAAKKLLELYKGEDVVAKEPFTWESDSWTMLKLQVRKARDGEFAIEGKAWKQGTLEPGKWTVSYVENIEPSAGRASIWGNPFAGTPIDFDDLVVSAVK